MKIKSRSIKIFMLFFGLYVFLGMCISYSVSYETNLFFGVDNYRAFLDLTDIPYSHYRIKVHPLFLILTQPIVLAIDGIINNPRLTVIILESFAGSLSVVLVWKILKELCINEKIRHLITLLYGFSFSLLFFSSVPETFIFSGLGLVYYWYMVYRASNNVCNKKTETIMFVLTGVISFGMTLTNYIPYCIGLIYYLTCRERNIKKIAKRFFLLNVTNAIVVIVLCVVQKMTWSKCPIFLESILVGLLGLGYEETAYMNWNINIGKTVNWFKGIFLQSVISPDVYLRKNENYLQIMFGDYSAISKVMLIVFLLIVLFALIKCILGLHTDNNQSKRRYVIALYISFIWNILLHYIYGANEAFMFTPHYIFMLYILLAIGISNIESNVIRKTIYYYLSLFASYELINNVYHCICTAKLALGIYDLHIPWVKAIVGVIFTFLIWYILSRIAERHYSCTWDKTVALEDNDEFKFALKVFAIYGIVTIITCAFISFNYDGIYGSLNYYWNGLLELKSKLLN